MPVLLRLVCCAGSGENGGTMMAIWRGIVERPDHGPYRWLGWVPQFLREALLLGLLLSWTVACNGDAVAWSCSPIGNDQQAICLKTCGAAGVKRVTDAMCECYPAVEIEEEEEPEHGSIDPTALEGCDSQTLNQLLNRIAHAEFVCEQARVGGVGQTL